MKFLGDDDLIHFVEPGYVGYAWCGEYNNRGSQSEDATVTCLECLVRSMERDDRKFTNPCREVKIPRNGGTKL